MILLLGCTFWSRIIEMFLFKIHISYSLSYFASYSSQDFNSISSSVILFTSFFMSCRKKSISLLTAIIVVYFDVGALKDCLYAWCFFWVFLCAHTTIQRSTTFSTQWLFFIINEWWYILYIVSFILLKFCWIVATFELGKNSLLF